MAQIKKNPARVCAKAGEVGRDRCIRDGGLAASSCDSSTFSKRGQRKTQRSSLPPGAGQGGRLWVIGSLVVSGFEVSTIPAKPKDSDGVEAKLQIAMSAATPLDHDAHRSPANQVDQNPKRRLRRKSESKCSSPGTKIPGSIAAKPGIVLKRPPAKVCVVQRYEDSNALAIRQEIGPASDNWAGPKDCGLWAAGAQARFDITTARRIPLTIRYKVFQNLTVEFVPHG